MSPKIPIYTESGEFLQAVSEDIARQLVQAKRLTIRRDKSKGRERYGVLLANEAHRLIGSSAKAAADSYRGIDKYTYHETFDAAPAGICTLKRYMGDGNFKRW